MRTELWPASAPSPQSPAEPGGPAHQGTPWASPFACPPGDSGWASPAPSLVAAPCARVLPGTLGPVRRLRRLPAGPLLPGLSSLCVLCRTAAGSTSSSSPVSLPPGPPLYSPTHALFWDYPRFLFEYVCLLPRRAPSCCFSLPDALGFPFLHTQAYTPSWKSPSCCHLSVVPSGAVMSISKSHFLSRSHSNTEPLCSYYTNFCDRCFH